MRTLLCAIPALLALAGMASAEPQQLDEAQLGGVAAGQDVQCCRPARFSITSTALSTTNSVAETVNPVARRRELEQQLRHRPELQRRHRHSARRAPA